MGNKKKKIAFLYLDKTYSVYHTVGIAIELSLLPNTEVVALCNQRSLPLLKSKLSESKNNVTIKLLRPYWYFQVPVYVEIKIQLRNILFKKYKSYLKSFDTIFSNIYSDLAFKKIVSDKSKMIFYDHGPANRAYSFDDAIKKYDYVLLHSWWEYEKRKELNQITKDSFAVIGYPKLDVISNNQLSTFFQNKNKTILYNPHWDKNFSSFYKYGIEILRFFKNNTNLNLIFAPHSLIIERYPKILWEIKEFKNCSNILIDLSSEKANDMSYTRYSDIYMGEFSSQVLEFSLLKRRPCIFINATNIKQKDFPISWSMGKVYDNFSANQLDSIVEESETLFNNEYSNIQLSIMEQTFSIPKNETSSFVAAKSIYEFLKG